MFKNIIIGSLLVLCTLFASLWLIDASDYRTELDLKELEKRELQRKILQLERLIP